MISYMVQMNMDAFQKRYPHLNWPWYRRKWFILMYDIGMAWSWCETKWWAFKSRKGT